MHHRHMQQRSSARVLQLAPPQKAVSCVNPEVEPKNSPRSWCEIKTEIHGPSATPRTIPLKLSTNQQSRTWSSICHPRPRWHPRFRTSRRVVVCTCHRPRLRKGRKDLDLPGWLNKRHSPGLALFSSKETARPAQPMPAPAQIQNSYDIR